MVASIEYIESVVSTFGKASQANWQTPGREGSTVILSTDLAQDLMVTGDLHGNRRNFNLIRRVAALQQNPRRHLVLQEVCHGGPTYPENGGCMSHTLLEDVAKLTAQFPGRVHFILGNHELAELTDYPIQKNKQMLNLLFRLGLQQMYGPSTEKIREAYSQFLLSCPLGVRLPEGIFITHSVPNLDARPFDCTIFQRRPEPTEYFDRDSIFELVWGRDYRPENVAAFATMVEARVLINGHEPCADGFCTPNQHQVILDCCAEKACYVILPVGHPLTQEEIVGRIQRL